MPEHFTRCQFSFNDISRLVVAEFDQNRASSDGGALLLKAVDERLGLTAGLSECLKEERQAGKIQHSQRELLRQRVFAIALGYADGNDAARLSGDPMHQLLVKEEVGSTLASQPSICRFENSIGVRELVRMSNRLAKYILKRHAKRLRGRLNEITIDIDATNDPTYGGQQLSFFNGHYNTYCYIPYIVSVQFNQEREQYVIGAILRAGNANNFFGVEAVLKRLLKLLRKQFKKIPLCVRLDGGFSNPDLFTLLDSEKITYMVGYAANQALREDTLPLISQVYQRTKRKRRSQLRYGELLYQARSWENERRVIYKAEVLYNSKDDIRVNDRYVVTNSRRSPRSVYKTYVGRCDMENRIKELKIGLEIDRTSCSRFFANQFRMLMTLAAYALYQELRLQARHTSAKSYQVWTFRERLLKLGAWIEQSVRRIRVHLPKHYPWLDDWMRLAKYCAPPA